MTWRYTAWINQRSSADEMRVTMLVVAGLLVLWYLCLRVLPMRWREVAQNVFVTSAGVGYAAALAFFVYTVVRSLV